MEHRLICICAFDALVSEDIAACVAEWDRAAAVRLFASREEMARELANVPSVFAVIAHGCSPRPDDAALPSLVASRGGWIVWVSDAPPATATTDAGCIHLAMPFTAEMLRDALNAAARRACPPTDA